MGFANQKVYRLISNKGSSTDVCVWYNRNITIKHTLIMKFLTIPKRVFKCIRAFYHHNIEVSHNKMCEMYLKLLNIIVIDMDRIMHPIIRKISHPNYASLFCRIFIENLFTHQWHYGCNGNLVQDIKGGTLKRSEQQNGPKAHKLLLVLFALNLQTPLLMSWIILPLQV